MKKFKQEQLERKLLKIAFNSLSNPEMEAHDILKTFALVLAERRTFPVDDKGFQKYSFELDHIVASAIAAKMLMRSSEELTDWHPYSAYGLNLLQFAKAATVMEVKTQYEMAIETLDDVSISAMYSADEILVDIKRNEA